ncbi:MAG: hypothetical protein AAFR51_06305 [Pseudomonadota bacterium]
MPKSRIHKVVLPLSLLGLAACGASAPATPPDRLSQAGQLAATCSGCHSGASGAIASLVGYSDGALVEAFQRYKTEIDGTSVMHRLARGYTDEQITAISAYLSSQEAAQ